MGILWFLQNSQISSTFCMFLVNLGHFQLNKHVSIILGWRVHYGNFTTFLISFRELTRKCVLESQHSNQIIQYTHSACKTWHDMLINSTKKLIWVDTWLSWLKTEGHFGISLNTRAWNLSFSTFYYYNMYGQYHDGTQAIHIYGSPLRYTNTRDVP